MDEGFYLPKQPNNVEKCQEQFCFYLEIKYVNFYF